METARPCVTVISKDRRECFLCNRPFYDDRTGEILMARVSLRDECGFIVEWMCYDCSKILKRPKRLIGFPREKLRARVIVRKICSDR